MPVLRQVPRKDISDENILHYYNRLFDERDPTIEPGTATGSPGDWWPVFALVPDVFQHATDGFKMYRNPKRTIDPLLRELGQTRAGWVKHAQFVYSQHCKSLRGLGVSEEKIAGIPTWGIETCYNEQERAILFYTDCLTAQNGRVPKKVIDKLKTFLTDEQILEFTYITCMYSMHAVISRALRLEFDDREDPITELAAPEGFSAADFLGGTPQPQKKK